MADEWKQISDLYHAALKLPENERSAFLQACIASDGVRREVASLLAYEPEGAHLLESPALEVAAKMMAENAPVLTIGQTLGHYQIKLQLGKGGMGEVYRAHDSNLGRDVAIKTLPPEFARDPDRVARFNREAKLLASLNHPNIAAIYGLEESGGTNFLVLELVEGETLSDFVKATSDKSDVALTKSDKAVPEILKLALQIAEAIEAAHEKGVIHRDLKPANIKVTPEGKVKVLDFGLAKAFAGEQAEVNLTNSPTLSTGATQQGVILGTAAYMSPEQARGKPVDKRADIWAFGCVLYEMLTGRAAFTGDDVSDLLAAVIRSEPDWSALPANLHWRLRETVELCLKKDAVDRWHDIGDVRLSIQKVVADPIRVSMPGIPENHRTKLRTIFPWVAASVVLTAIIAAWSVWQLRPSEPRQVVRSEYSLPANRQFTNLTGSMLAVSPDGRQYVYVTAEGLYLRSTDAFNANLIAGTGTSPANPFFSPDGKWIGYSADSKLKKIAIAGGEPETLCDASGFMGGSWGTDNRIVYAVYQKGIYRISADAGTPVLIVKGVCFYPQLLPDGKSMLYTSGPPPYKIVVQSLQSGEPKELFAGKNARYISTGHVVYAEGSNLFARPFDYKTLKVTGEAVPVVEAVLGAAGIYTAHYAVSDSGTLVYIPTTGEVAQRTLVWVDRDANEIPIAAPPNDYHSPRISPDGTRVAVSVGGDIYIWDLIHRTPLRRLTFERTNGFPLWTVDSKRLAFWSLRDGRYDAYWRSADGIAKEELLGGKLGLRSFVPADWADNGKTLVTTSWENNYMSGIGMLSMEGNRKFQFLMDEKHLEAHPRISPDGRWMVYTSSESGRNEIYIRSFPDMNVREQLTWSGGNSPLWSENAIFYRNGDSVIAVSVKTSPAFIFGTPRTLFQDTYVRTVNSPGSEDFETWDISPDGKKFLMMKDSSTGSGPRKINIVMNWFEELKQRVPVK